MDPSDGYNGWKWTRRNEVNFMLKGIDDRITRIAPRSSLVLVSDA